MKSKIGVKISENEYNSVYETLMEWKKLNEKFYDYDDFRKEYYANWDDVMPKIEGVGKPIITSTPYDGDLDYFRERLIKATGIPYKYFDNDWKPEPPKIESQYEDWED